MKKLLIMAKSLGGGGSEVALIELINKIALTEYEVTLALLDKDNEFVHRLKTPVNIVTIDFKKTYQHRLVSMYSFVAKVLKKLCVNKYIHFYNILFDSVMTNFEEEYDIAIDFYGYGYFLTGFLAKRIKAKKKATWLHDEKVIWFKNVEQYANEFDKIFGVSIAVKDSFITSYPKFKDKTDVFYNTIDVQNIKQKSEEDIEVEFDSSFNILTVGRLTEQKGYDIAIQAASIMRKKGIEFKWYSIGQGKDKTKLTKEIKKQNLENHFFFLGRKENPYPYMKQCDLYVQPSRHEGYVITLVEARVLNLPIVASDIPSSREQIQDGYNGYIVSLTPDQLANKIIQIYEDKKKISFVINNLKNEKIDFSKEIKKLDTL